MIGIGLQLNGGAGFDPDRDSGFAGGEGLSQVIQVDRPCSGLGQTGDARVSLKETSQGSRLLLDQREAVTKIGSGFGTVVEPIQAACQATGDRFDGGQGIVEFVSQDPDQSLPRGAFLFPQGVRQVGDGQELVGTTFGANGGPPQLESADRTGKAAIQSRAFVPCQAIAHAQLQGAGSDELFFRPR